MLLADAGRPIARLRPAVYPAEAQADWEALLRFRHFLRHAYGVPWIRPSCAETLPVSSGR